jgi:hypothetical protein
MLRTNSDKVLPKHALPTELRATSFPVMTRQDSNLRPFICNDVVPAAFAVKGMIG